MSSTRMNSFVVCTRFMPMPRLIQDSPWPAKMLASLRAAARALDRRGQVQIVAGMQGAVQELAVGRDVHGRVGDFHG